MSAAAPEAVLACSIRLWSAPKLDLNRKLDPSNVAETPVHAMAMKNEIAVFNITIILLRLVTEVCF